MTLGPLKAELQQLQLEYDYAKFAYENQRWYYAIVVQYQESPFIIAAEKCELANRKENLDKVYRSLVRIRV